MTSNHVPVKWLLTGRITATGKHLAPASGFVLLTVLLFIAASTLGAVSLVTVVETATRREKEDQLLFVGLQYQNAIASYYNTDVPSPPHPTHRPAQNPTPHATPHATPNLTPHLTPRTASHAQSHSLPPTLDVLVNDFRLGVARHHLREIYPDPVTGRADWMLVYTRAGIVGVHSRSDQAPLRQSGFTKMFASFNSATHYCDWVFGMQP